MNCWKRKDKFTYLYDESCEKIDKEFNVIKILKKVKQMRILIKNSLMTPSIKTHIEHDPSNLIWLSHSSSCESSQEEEVKELNESEKHTKYIENLPFINHELILHNLCKNMVVKRKAPPKNKESKKAVVKQ